jgi:hypothetical protein
MILRWFVVVDEFGSRNLDRSLFALEFPSESMTMHGAFGAFARHGQRMDGPS